MEPADVEELKNAHDLDGLMKGLGDNDFRVRLAVAKALGDLGDQRAVKPLLAFLEGGESFGDVAAAAAESVGKLGGFDALMIALRVMPFAKEDVIPPLLELRDDRAVEPLIGLLDEEEDELAGRAAEALAEFGDPRAVEPLIRTLGHDEAFARWASASALGQLGDRRAVEPLIATARDQDWQVREQAVGALGKLGDPLAVEPLVAALEDEEEEVRLGAEEALKEIGGSEAKRALSERGAQVRRKPELEDDMIENLKKDGDVDALIGALKDDNGSVREQVAEALKELRDPRAGEPLVAVVADARITNTEKQCAGDALASLGEPAVEPVIGLLGHEDKWVRLEAISILGRLGPRGVKPLIAALQDEDGDVREVACSVLERVGGPDAEQAVVDYRARPK